MVVWVLGMVFLQWLCLNDLMGRSQKRKKSFEVY